MLNSFVICVVGLSGAGKTTIVENFLAHRSPNASQVGISRLVTTTTRPMRHGEQEGKDYFFIPRDEFEKKNAKGQMFAVNEFGKNLYGCDKSLLNPNHAYFFIIDAPTAVNLKKQHPNQIKIVYFKVGLDELAKRLQTRAEVGFEDRIAKNAKDEAEIIALQNQFDATIDNNGDLEKAEKALQDFLAKNLPHP